MVETAEASQVKLQESLVRIEVIRVRHFRGLKDCVVALQPDLTLLVGRNSSGKSRLLRALGLACGAVSASSDDFTVGSTDEPIIDLILAPASTAPDATFDDRIRSIFGRNIQLTSITTGSERIGWRTAIKRSNEGWGARTESRMLTYDGGVAEWKLPANSATPSREQRKVLAGDLVETGRDLAAEMTRQGSSIRRVLDSLEVPEGERKALEKDLQELGGRIVSKSLTLAAIRARLEDLEQHVGGIGKPSVSAIPGRLEELVRMVELALDTGSGGLPLRVHGSGARSLASLKVQSVLYDRRLGQDGTAIPTHPVTLVEEPESHLHPQACFELVSLLSSVPGQVVASTHSSHLVTAARTESLRLVRIMDGLTEVQDLNPTDNLTTTPAARRVDLATVEWEKIKRFVERPFGELLFASAIVIGDGASERAFLPYLFKKRLGADSAGICVVDPGSMSQASPLVKYAEAVGIPCIVFLDCDDAGRRDEKNIPKYAKRVWATGDKQTDGALEEVLSEFDAEWVLEQCDKLLAIVPGTALERLKALKGTYGAPLGRSFIERYPDHLAWPSGFKQLVEALSKVSVEVGN